MKIFDNRGQGLVEGLAAITVIVLALASLIGLTIYNLSGQKISEDTLIAINLAREGIEVVRNIRDSSGSSAIASGSAIVIFNPNTNVWTLNFSSSYRLDNVSTRLYKKNNLYLYDSVTSEPTKFYRLITINKAGALEVKSQVRWAQKSGRYQTYTLTEILYDWR